MVNEILLRGAIPIAAPAPVQAPAAPASSDGFSQALLAELDGPAPAAMKGAAAAPALAAPKTISLDTLPVQPPTMVAPPEPPAAAGGTYTVQAGDSLSKIARKLGHGNWQKLYAANKGVVGADPNMIHPGQVLTLPSSWQAATNHVAAKAPSVQAAVEPAAKAPTVVAGTAPAQVPSAPVVAPPSLPLEAAVEPEPGRVAPAAALPETEANPAAVGVATEAIDRLTATAGGQDHVATLREALKSIPPGHASFDAYKAKVDAYEAAIGATAPAPAGGAPTLAAPVAPLPPQGGVDATSAAPGDAYGPTAPAPEVGMTPEPPTGAVVDAQVTQPAPAAIAPAPTTEDAGDAASEDGEEGWQAFS